MITNIDNYIISRKIVNGPEQMFYMYFRTFNHTDGVTETYTFDGASFSSLFFYTATGSPVLKTAVVEYYNGVVENVKNGDYSISNFTLSFSSYSDYHTLRLTWVGGLFSMGSPYYSLNTSYRNIVYSSGCKLVGDYDIPNYFMANLFYGCTYYSSVGYDMSELNPTTIGSYFLYDTWYQCKNMNMFNIYDYFDTSNWKIKYVGNYALYGTWAGCANIYTMAALDTRNWELISIGTYFMYATWNGAFTNFNGSSTLTLKGNFYTGTLRSLNSNSGAIENSKIQNIKVDPELISVYQNSVSWSNITDSKFISW
jgi:hypothetical protein